MIIPSLESLNIVENIAITMKEKTFHHHYHLLLDIANTYPKDYRLTYLEIGAYAGGSACLMMHRPHTDVISIDLGWPIDPEIVLKNVWQFNKHQNSYSYIKGDSKSDDVKNRVKNVKADILFIDGDHSYMGVWNDFLNYRHLVNNGGYIVFDDYNDHMHSPMVKSAVDHICNLITDDFEIIGTFSNIFNAKGDTNEAKDGNCFVIRKKDKLPGFDIPIAICIATYYKEDGSTIKLLEKTLDSVFNQTYKNFKVFLYGDHYTNEDQVVELIKKYPSDKIIFKNIPYARERQLHKDKKTLWKYGGVNTVNKAIDYAIDCGYSYVARLDHDDLWENNHLQEIVNCVEITGADFICTRAKHVTGFTLPIIFETLEKYVKFYPIYNQIVHSSVCMNFAKIPLRYRDLWLDNGSIDSKTLPGDGDMWERCRKYMISNSLRSVCINKVTCIHDTETT